jgi:hypothetical protein
MVSKTLGGAKILEPKYRSLAESQDLSDILTAFTTTKVVNHSEANNQEPSPKIVHPIFFRSTSNDSNASNVPIRPDLRLTSEEAPMSMEEGALVIFQLTFHTRCFIDSYET